MAQVTLPGEPLCLLLDFSVLLKDCLNQVRSLLSTRVVLLGYSFEPRPNSRALGTAGSVMTIGRVNEWMLALEKIGLTRENKIN